MTSRPLRLLTVAVALLGLSGGRAQGQCIGFDRFPDDVPQSVVASGHQKAYIYHANGVERIVLQPSYTGVAKDFGVFLAVPEIPSIEKVDEALFSELHSLTTPRMIRAAKSEARVQVSRGVLLAGRQRDLRAARRDLRGDGPAGLGPELVRELAHPQRLCLAEGARAGLRPLRAGRLVLRGDAGEPERGGRVPLRRPGAAGIGALCPGPDRDADEAHVAHPRWGRLHLLPRHRLPRSGTKHSRGVPAIQSAAHGHGLPGW